MTQTDGETGALPLFNHTARKDWGVAVLIREDGGKRAYVFEDGEERTMANGFHQLMRRVEQPSVDQRAFYERQRGLLAAREKASSRSLSDGPSFLDQLEKLHKTYPGGLADPKWVADVRGDGKGERGSRQRDALIRDAQERLSAAALDGILKAGNFNEVWDVMVSVLSRTDLVPAAQLKKPKSANSEALRGFALAVRELLWGKVPYEQRFNAYLAALTQVVGEAPRWELATALSAVVNPAEHICVHPTAFRNQLKVMGTRGSAPARATGAGYTRFLNVARLVSTKLIEQSQPPRDLFDVYDFVRITLGPAVKARAPSAKASAKRAEPAAPAEDEESDSDE
jgi:hypothetical protein